MNRWEMKIAAVAVSFLVPLLFTLLPYKMSRWIAGTSAKGERMLCYLMCFGGGIFFGTFLLHIAPEVRDILETTLLDPNGITYPVADLIIGCGFFFVLYLEKIVMCINKHRLQRQELRMQQNCFIFRSQLIGEVCSGCKEGKQCLGQVREARETDESLSASDADESKTKSGAKVSENVKGRGSISEEGTAKETETDRDTPTDQDTQQLESSSHHNVRSLILIIALSMHHIFEGLALGLQRSTDLVFTLLFALMCHETIISFSLGLQFVRCQYNGRQMLVVSVCCSMVLPLGVTLGTILSEVKTDCSQMDVVNGIVQAFSSGTFVFVTFFEIFQQEISPHDTSFGKVTSAAIGFALMALMVIVR